MTAWRMPAWVASAKNASKKRVRAAIASGICWSFQVESSVVDVGGVQVSGGPAGEEVDADGAHEWLGELVVDQGVVGLGGDGSGRGNHRRGGSNAGGEVPGVVVGARHCVLLGLVGTVFS